MVYEGGNQTVGLRFTGIDIPRGATIYSAHLQFLADENFNNDMVRGVRRRAPDVDILRVQDAGLQGADDPAILEWAANAERVVLTHDVANDDATCL